MNDYCKEYNLNPLFLPKHIGIVMDGNGRWAIKQKLPRLKGHHRGVDRVQEICEICGKLGIPALTLYAFSDENWRRPEDEVNGIMGLLRWYIRKEHAKIAENNVQFRVIGDRQKLSTDIISLVDNLEEDTKNNTGLKLSVALSYGARGEIVRAVKKIARRVATGEFFTDDIDERIFETFLDTHGLPPVDMFIRTSGELRLSNFLLWQIAYAELFFDETLWPDFTVEKFIEHLRAFCLRERRFGMTSAQVATSENKKTFLSEMTNHKNFLINESAL